VTLNSDSLAIQAALALQHKHKENDSPQLCAGGDSESIETVKEAHATAIPSPPHPTFDSKKTKFPRH
jgi:hypothetical protein